MPRDIEPCHTFDAVAALISAPLGTSPATVYLESGAGIAQGGRTGLVALVAGLLFVPLPVPVAAVVARSGRGNRARSDPRRPLHVRADEQIRWTDIDEAIPAFLAVVLIPLTFSITLGLSLAIIAYVLIQLILRRAGDVKPVMSFVALLAAALIAETQ